MSSDTTKIIGETCPQPAKSEKVMAEAIVLLKT